MKNLILVFIAMACFTSVNASEYKYIPIVREGVQWVYNCRFFDAELNRSNYTSMTLEFKGDTTINGYEYKKLYRWFGTDATATKDSNRDITFEISSEPEIIAFCRDYFHETSNKTQDECITYVIYAENYINETYGFSDGVRDDGYKPVTEQNKVYMLYERQAYARTSNSDLNQMNTFYAQNTKLFKAQHERLNFEKADTIEVNGTLRKVFSVELPQDNSLGYSYKAIWIDGIGLDIYGEVSMSKSGALGTFISPFGEIYARGYNLIIANLNHVTEDGKTVYKGDTYDAKYDSNPSGIDDVNVTTLPSDDSYYNMQGQRVSEPQAGIYIHNGKKVVVK